MTAAIDTNVLLDILLSNNQFYEQSKVLLDKYGKGALIISPIVYAELFTQFLKIFDKEAGEEIHQFLKRTGVKIADLTKKDLERAAQAWLRYCKEAKRAECPSCGRAVKYLCTECKKPVLWRNHMITDFLIGAHAENNADVLITRDRGYYKKYFRVEVA